MCEEWQEAEDFPGYFVSNLGRVKGKMGSILAPQFNPVTGYYHVNIYHKNGKKRTTTIHRLVAKAFIPAENGKTQVNHKDGNKKNNVVSNLEWVTASQNRKHAYQHGLFDKEKIRERGLHGGIGSRKNLGRKIVVVDGDGNKLLFDSIRQAAESLNINHTNLSRVANGKKHYHSIKGYTAYFE